MSVIDILDHVSDYKHVIWDWNGTLLDDSDLVVDITAQHLEEMKLPALTLEKYRDVFCFPIKEYYQRIGVDFSVHSFEAMGDRFISNYHSRISETQLFRGLTEWLEKIQKSGIKQSILSAAKQAHLEQLLPHFGIDHHFENIFGIDNHYAASKVQRGKDLIANLEHRPEECILIGDTDHDLEVGQELGVDVLLIADGHQSEERLKEVHENVLSSRFLSLH